MVSKAASPRNIDGLMWGCLVLKSFKVGSKALESASDLSSSVDFAFFQLQCQDEKQDNSCCKNQWSEQFQVHW